MNAVMRRVAVAVGAFVIGGAPLVGWFLWMSENHHFDAYKTAIAMLWMVAGFLWSVWWYVIAMEGIRPS